MTLKRKQPIKIPSFDMPVSYLAGETRMRFRDALNVFSNQGKTETRYGRSRLNKVALPASIRSLSYFRNSAGQRFILAKSGDKMFAVDSSGNSTLIKSGLTDEIKHRGLTVARGESSRHIIALDNDGLFQFNGTNITQLGQDPPVAPTVATVTGTVANGTYRVGLTFYSSKTGFETNLGTLSAQITITGSGIKVSDIPLTALNTTIDKVRIYLKNTTSADDAVFVVELALGTATYEITATPISTTVPPLGMGKPMQGGGQFLLDFNGKLVVLGNNNFKNDAFFSEEYIPDAFNDGSANGRLVLYIPGDGIVSGGAIGLYNNSHLDPFIVIFKNRSTHIYSELGGEGKFVTLSWQIGCVSHDTIQVKDGVVYFLSDQGWRAIRNGSFIVDDNGNPITLGMGEIDDIFKTPGFTYEVNRSRLNDTFSVYYSALDQYITWVAEGARNDFSKAYVYEFKKGGFKPYEFATSATAACIGEDADGIETVFMADANGFIYKHSTKEAKQDEGSDGKAIDISAFAQFIWLTGNDMDANYDFRNFLIRRLVGSGDLELKVWVNYSMDNQKSYIIKGPVSGFVLDYSRLDLDSFGQNDRSIISDVVDVNSSCESILFGFYQKGKGLNLGLVSAQIDYSQNRTRR